MVLYLPMVQGDRNKKKKDWVDRMKVKMLKTQYPQIVPNGTIGDTTEDVTKPGLHFVTFPKWEMMLVYPHEVEPYPPPKEGTKGR